MNPELPDVSRKARRRRERLRRSRRVRALLAAGLVLGIGASVTLAAWHDSQDATATLTAGTFRLQGSVNGGEFQRRVDTAHVLPFSPETGALFPGSTRYSVFSVRTEPNSIGGSVQLRADAGNNAGLGQFLRYGVVRLDNATCNSSTFNAAHSDGNRRVVDRGSALTAATSQWHSVGANTSAPVHYCMEIQLPATGNNNSAQGQTANPRWEVFGTTGTGG